MRIIEKKLIGMSYRRKKKKKDKDGQSTINE